MVVEPLIVKSPPTVKFLAIVTSCGSPTCKDVLFKEAVSVTSTSLVVPFISKVSVLVSNVSVVLPFPTANVVELLPTAIGSQVEVILSFNIYKVSLDST